jgi:hypothetical protein
MNKSDSEHKKKEWLVSGLSHTVYVFQSLLHSVCVSVQSETTHDVHEPMHRDMITEVTNKMKLYRLTH